MDEILVATQRYRKAMHAVQSAIAAEIEISGLAEAGASPKHLRVGVNSAMINDRALSELLIAKGIFTQEEYTIAIADAAEKEQEILTQQMTHILGYPVQFE